MTLIIVTRDRIYADTLMVDCDVVVGHLAKLHRVKNFGWVAGCGGAARVQKLVNETRKNVLEAECPDHVNGYMLTDAGDIYLTDPGGVWFPRARGSMDFSVGGAGMEMAWGLMTTGMDPLDVFRIVASQHTYVGGKVHIAKPGTDQYYAEYSL